MQHVAPNMKKLKLAKILYNQNRCFEKTKCPLATKRGKNLFFGNHFDNKEHVQVNLHKVWPEVP